VGYLFSKLSFDDKLRIVVSNRDHVSELVIDVIETNFKGDLLYFDWKHPC